MPYKTNDDLPPAVKNNIPEHAQDIFRNAFNHALGTHIDDEITCFKIAWSAVTKQYEKNPITHQYEKKDKS